MQNILINPCRNNENPMQEGDVTAACADISDISGDVGFGPATSLEEGIDKFVTWYRSYYNIK